jgi:hypothetical protein
LPFVFIQGMPGAGLIFLYFFRQVGDRNPFAFFNFVLQSQFIFVEQYLFHFILQGIFWASGILIFASIFLQGTSVWEFLSIRSQNSEFSPAFRVGIAALGALPTGKDRYEREKSVFASATADPSCGGKARCEGAVRKMAVLSGWVKQLHAEPRSKDKKR